MIVGGYITNDTPKQEIPPSETNQKDQTFNRVLGVYSWGQGIGLDLFFL
jgi:hypothetical protein